MRETETNRACGHTLARRQLLLGAALGLGASVLPAAAAQTPRKGGTLRMGLEGGSPSDSLDPRAISDAVPLVMSLMLWNNLIEIDDNGNAVGELFESWEVRPGAADWTFNIRKGIVFTSGKSLDADDVIYSLNLHRGDTKSPAKSLLADITEIRRLSAHQVQIILANGNVDLPFNLSDFHVVVLPKGWTDFSRPDGTGAYALEEFQPGVRAIFKKKPGSYWKPDRGNFERVEIRYISDTVARTQALVTGLVDVINRVEPKTAAMLARNKGLRISRTPGMGNRYAFVAQTDKGAYANRDLMLALKYGVDRQKIVANVFAGFATPGNDHTVGAKMKFYDSRQSLMSYDPERARFHYKKSGFTEPLELHVSEGAFSGATDAGQVYQESLSKAGIRLKLTRASGDGYWDNVWLKVPFCAVYWANRPTVDNQLTTTFQAGSSWNDTHFNNAEFERLLVAARVELDEARRAALYARCQELISQNSGMVCFAIQDYLDACSTRLSGLTLSGRFDLADCRIPEKGWFNA